MLPLSFDSILDRALAEDLSSGDVTSEACIMHTTQAVAHAVARGPIVVCGGSVFARVFAKDLQPGRFHDGRGTRRPRRDRAG